MTKLSQEDLKKLADRVAFDAPVIMAQRDPNDPKMDERSALLHRLWIRISGKINVRAGGFPNLKDETTHEQVFLEKLKLLLDTHLEPPMDSQTCAHFIDEFMQKSFKQLGTISYSERKRNSA